MINSQADFGSNEIHVTPLQYSVTFLVLLVVFDYISDRGPKYLFSYFGAMVIVFVIDYILQDSVLKVFKYLNYNHYFFLKKIDCMNKFLTRKK